VLISGYDSRMTPKSIISADFNELRTIEVRCRCSTVICMSLTADPVNVFACPSCHFQLWGPDDNPSFNLVSNLIGALAAWKARDKSGKSGFTLGFTLNSAS
jgi:hypothetical protein